MPRRVTVVLRAVDAGHDDWLVPVARALDLQTLPSSDFEVLAVTTPGSALHARLTDLAARRPNVRVVDDGVDVAAVAAGTWLIDLGTDVARCRPLLDPAALAALADAGDRTGADIVLGRTVAAVTGVAGGPVPAVDALVPGATPGAGVLAAAAAGGGTTGTTDTAGLRPLVVTRTERLRAADPGPGAEVVTVAEPVSATLTVPAPEGLVAPTATATASWVEGVLRLRAELATQSAPPSGGGPDARRGVLGVRRADTGAEYFLTTATTHEDGVLVAEADLDVLSAAAGSPLPRAVWDVTFGVHGTTAGVSARGSLPRVEGLSAALVGGVPVVPTGTATLGLGVGGVGGSVVGTARPEDATVSESARGTLLRLELPRLHAARDARVRGSLRMGTFPVPADLVVEDGAARLECWLTGLAGTSDLSVVFGGQAAPTGLTLDVSEVGVMTLRSTPRKPAVATQRSAAAKKPKAPPSKALAARARRAVPPALEPAVRGLRRNRLARSAYSALIRRG